jgi:hypothetical protein
MFIGGLYAAKCLLDLEQSQAGAQAILCNNALWRLTGAGT